MVSNFSFLENNYPELFTISELSEKLIRVDPSSSLAKSRLLSEKLAQLIWEFEDLDVFQGNQVERINQLFYKNAIPDVVIDTFHTIRKKDKQAAETALSALMKAKNYAENEEVLGMMAETKEDKSYESL